MSTFVLVHGSWHGAWCWYKIVPRLEAAGHRAVAIDLPGHGRDWQRPGDVTMQDFVDAISCAIDAQDDDVVLVGHSRGGIAITQAAEARSERIRKLVYLAAYLIGDGETIVPYFMSDADSLIMPRLILNRDEGWDMLKREAFRGALYADCPDEDVALANALLTPEPAAPTATPIRTTPERWGSIPRTYIHLRNDRAVSGNLQKRMFTAIPCEQVIAMDTSHSAYFSAPDELARNLISLAS
jgi:pimeloyl-ACP methyl ester carboxylesterase